MANTVPSINLIFYMNNKLDESSSMNDVDYKSEVEKSPKNNHTSRLCWPLPPVHLTKHTFMCMNY